MKIEIKPRINKRNGQINFSLPRKKLNDDIIKKISKGNKFNVFFEEW